MADINDLLIRIDATTETLRREMRKAEKITEQSATRMDRFLGKIDRGFSRMNAGAAKAKVAIGALLGALAVRQATSFVKSQVEIADAIGKSALVAGTTAEQIQELRFAFGQLAGTQDREVDESLRRLNRRLGLAAQGAKAYRDAFAELGVELEDGSGQLRSTSDVLEDTLKGLSTIANDATRAAVASQVFGEDAGPKLAAALGGGITAVNDLRSAINRDGGVISSEAVLQAAAMNDEFDRLSRVLTAQTAEAVVENAESIEMLATAIGKASAAAISGASSVADFVSFLGEELASRIHGIAADDVPRLTGALRDASVELERLENLHGKGLLANRGTQSPQDQVAAQRAIVDQLKARLEIGQRLDAQERRNAAGRSPKPVTTPTGGGIAAPVATGSSLGGFTSIGDARFGEAFDKYEARLAQLAEAEQFFRSTRTEVEQLEAQIARVQELSASGVFPEGMDPDQIISRFQDQIESLEDETVNASTRMGEVLAQNVGGAVDELFSGGKLSASNFAEAVLRDLARITAQLFIMKPLIEGLFGAGGGSGGFGQGVFKAFGFEKGGEFTVGGSSVPDSNFVPLALTRGEHVKISPPGQQSGGDVQVNIMTTGPSDAVSTSERSVDGMRVIDVLVDNALSKKFANGSIDRMFAASGMSVPRRGQR